MSALGLMDDEARQEAREQKQHKALEIIASGKISQECADQIVREAFPEYFMYLNVITKGGKVNGSKT